MKASGRARLGLAVVCTGALVGPFDTTVNTAFPVITGAFALAPGEIQWVVIAYVLAQSAFAMVFGHVGDRIGHRRVFAVGLLASAFAHAAVALSPDFPTFVGMRALQGMAVGITLACAPALATLMFPPERKGRVLALYAATASLGMAAAPWLGGLLLDAFGWPGVYWFRVPLALVALGMIAWLPRPPPAVAPGPSSGFDWIGALGLSAVLSALVLAAAALARPQPPAFAPLLLVAGCVGAVLFATHEARAPHPVLRMAPFRSVRFSALQVASIVVNFACFANLLLLPYVLTDRLAASIVAAGLVLSAYPTGSVLGSLASARLVRGRSAAWSMTAGLAIAATGLAAIGGVLALAPHPGLLAAAMFGSGLGLGLFGVGYMDETTSMLPVTERGVAGSLVNVTRLIGVVFGAAGVGRLQAATGDVTQTFLALGGLILLTAFAFRRLAARTD